MIYTLDRSSYKSSMPSHDTQLWQMWGHANIAWDLDLSRMDRNTFTNLLLYESSLDHHDPTYLIDLTIILLCQAMTHTTVEDVGPCQHCLGFGPFWVG